MTVSPCADSTVSTRRRAAGNAARPRAAVKSPVRRSCPRTAEFWLLAALGLALAGCNDNPLGRLAVSGKINFDGAPLDKGTIDFRPAKGARGVASGASVIDGRYQIEAKRGLPPGTYEVRIFSSREDTSPLPEGVAPGGQRPGIERLPPKVNVETELEVTVTAGAVNEFNFDVPAH